MTNHIVSDALFMAQVWQTIKEHGYEFVAENGDPDGVDFVANRIVEEAAQQSAQSDVVYWRCSKCGDYNHENRQVCEMCQAPRR